MNDSYVTFCRFARFAYLHIMLGLFLFVSCENILFTLAMNAHFLSHMCIFVLFWRDITDRPVTFIMFTQKSFFFCMYVYQLKFYSILFFIFCANLKSELKTHCISV